MRRYVTAQRRKVPVRIGLCLVLMAVLAAMATVQSRWWFAWGAGALVYLVVSAAQALMWFRLWRRRGGTARGW